MAGRRAGRRLTAALWFVAAVLAWTAVAVRYAHTREVGWGTALAGLFCAAMGVGALARARGTGAPEP